MASNRRDLRLKLREEEDQGVVGIDLYYRFNCLTMNLPLLPVLLILDEINRRA
ncbi:hypothetical protein [Sideroxydans sp. CL21]|uniref:hypothetical protein n=1 Tax=Sideroxydans sp. CL21 TaxID=2600596 RepID=UPI0024BC0A37|nr:hypothetical protein [Sideroxydans sp. CL21]